MAWTDETKAEVIAEYQDRGPTPENSMDIVKELAEETGQTPNGVRMILSKAGVYVKKAPAAKASSDGSGGDKPKRISKAEQIEKLNGVLTDAGIEIDSDIIEKLTGKAALYFFEVVSKITKED
jgi:transposase-like protein